MSAILNLNDTARVVELVPADTIAEWDTTGNVGDAAYWLGNASQHDRDEITAYARHEAARGYALRVTFPSVITFILGYVGKGRYGCYVPSDHA